MQSNISLDEVMQEVVKADTAISNTDSETFKAWLKHKVKPVQWEHKQYALDERFWVVATLNNSCLYFNCIEEGWGWGKFCSVGTIEKYHWEQEELYEAFIWRYKDQVIEI